MKLFYKRILAFILFVMPFNCLFAQQLAVGPSFAYDFIKNAPYDKASGLTLGISSFFDLKKHFSFQTGFLFLRKSAYYKKPTPDLPLQYIPNNAYPPKGTFYYPYDVNYVYKSLQIPVNVSYKFYRNHFIDIYALAGTSFLFRLNEFAYGEQYLIIDDTITDYTLSHYNYSGNSDEIEFKGMRIEIAIGADVILSNHIKTGIEIQSNNGFNHDEWYERNYYSLALIGKYYFDEIKRPKK